MFRVESKAAKRGWIESSYGEDGSSTENMRVGDAKRSRQRYESMREESGQIPELFLGGAMLLFGLWTYRKGNASR